MIKIALYQNIDIKRVAEKVAPNGAACPRCGATLKYFSDCNFNDAYCPSCDFAYDGPFGLVMDVLGLDTVSTYEYFEAHFQSEIASIKDEIESGEFEYAVVNRIRRKINDPFQFSDIYSAAVGLSNRERAESRPAIKAIRFPSGTIDDLVIQFGHIRMQQSGLLDERDRLSCTDAVVPYYDTDGETVIYIGALDIGKNLLAKQAPAYNLRALTAQGKVFVCSSVDIFDDLVASRKNVLLMAPDALLQEQHVALLKAMDVCVASSDLIPRLRDIQTSLTVLMHRITNNVPIVRKVKGRGGLYHMRETKQRRDETIEKEYSVKPFGEQCVVFERQLPS